MATHRSIRQSKAVWRGPTIIALVCVVGIALLAAPESQAKRAGTASSAPTDSAIRRGLPAPFTYKPDLTVGERLVYEINWSGIPAGSCELTVKWIEPVRGGRAFLVRARTRSNRLVSYFYPVDNDVRSLIDVEGGFSRQFALRCREGRVRREEGIRFEYEAGRASYERARKTAFSQVAVNPIPVGRYFQDPLSALYALRAFELPPDGSVALSVHTCRRAWPLVVTVLGRETIDLGRLGAFQAVRVRVEHSFPGLLVRRGTITAHFDRKTRIPLRMTVDIPIGTIVATLVRAERSPLVSSPESTSAQR